MAVIYYQNTTDGRAAAAIVKRAIRGGYAVPTNFNYSPDWKNLNKGESIFLLGVVFDMNAMWELNRDYKLTYIDHHESSGTVCQQGNFRARYGILDTSESTSVLTWKYFFQDDPVPKAIQMIGDYTLNRLGDPKLLEFWEGMNSLNARPEQAQLWDNLLSDDLEAIERICSRGKEILEFSENENLALSKDLVYKTELCGYSCLAANYRASSSRFFTPVLDKLGANSGIDLLILYCWVGFIGGYKATVFSNKEDLNIIPLLESLHGGGQPGVGSFLTDTLPFKEEKMTIDLHPKVDCKEFLNTHLIARQFKQMGNRSAYNQASYYLVLGELNCAVINNPSEDKSIFNYVNKNLPQIDIGITWVWENSGRYKVVIFPLSGKFTQKGMINFISKLGYEGGASVIDDGYLFYVNKLPFPIIKRNESNLLTNL